MEWAIHIHFPAAFHRDTVGAPDAHLVQSVFSGWVSRRRTVVEKSTMLIFSSWPIWDDGPPDLFFYSSRWCFCLFVVVWLLLCLFICLFVRLLL